MKDDTSLATKADIHRIEETMTKIAESVQRVDEHVGDVITILENVDKRLTQSVEEHETRVVRLEEHAGISRR